MLFVVEGLKRLWMKCMRRNELESDWIDERDRDAKAGSSICSPCVYLPFLKGTSIHIKQELKNTWYNKICCLSKWFPFCLECR